MIRKEALEKLGYMSEEEKNRWNQDLHFWFCLLIEYPEILYIPKPLVKRTNHAAMLSQKWCGVGNDILFPEISKKCLEAGINIL